MNIDERVQFVTVRMAHLQVEIAPMNVVVGKTRLFLVTLQAQLIHLEKRQDGRRSQIYAHPKWVVMQTVQVVEIHTLI